VRRRDRRLVGFALAAVTVVCVLVNEQDVGIARDEVVYVNAGARYADWWLHLGKGEIAQTFGGQLGGGNNPEHPPLVKTLSGFSHKVFHDAIPIFDELTAFRLPSALLHGLCVLLVYFMVLELWGFAEAVIAALSLLLLPRALFHAGLACFDAPIMTLWFATVYAYWRCRDGRPWPWQVGVVWGLALATKHTALLLPIALAVHHVVLAWRARDALHGWRVAVSVAVLGPLVLYAVWPLLWTQPYERVSEWIRFHLHHVHYNYEYLGDNWNAPRFPWHVAIVTTLFTVPVATLAAAAIGAGVLGVRWRRKESVEPRRAPVLLLVLSLGAAMGPFLLGGTPIFGAEKHWMPALPTLCIAAGVGAVWAARRLAAAARVFVPRLGERLAERIAIGAVGGAIALAGVTEVVTAHPYALTWYNAAAGGAPGGADLGMNRQFWGVAARGVLPVIAREPPGPVYTHDASPAWGWYQKLGLLPPGHPDSGWEVAGITSSKLAIVIHEKHFNRHDYLIWAAYGTVQPIFVLRADGVPIVSVYKK
jgi:4-amino-4-deoxy-L-arabinose transferase-like glycosyltransferase